MNGTISMRVIFTIVLLIALAVLLAIFYTGSLGFLNDYLSKLIVLK